MCIKYSLAYGSVIIYTTVSIIILLLITHKKSFLSLNSEGEKQNVTGRQNISIEVWGKASIAMYLWEHILEGELLIVENGMGKIGKLSVDNLTFNYKYGPIFIQTTVPKDVEFLILVLNGRSDEKIKVAKGWLDYLSKYSKLKKVIAVILGNESCNNNWILPYMNSRGGVINVVFLVYDSTLVDNVEFFQWPLGVAKYRGFENVHEEDVNVTAKRPFICNFLGTVYTNSSRSSLFRIINSLSITEKCPIIGRKLWVPSETDESLSRYIKTLENSDLTLCPVGQNAECYRIYEALSYGSVPIVEDKTTPGVCDKNAFRLLKSSEAPFIFIKDWKELPEVLKLEMHMPQRLKRKRRMNILKWYSRFKNKMRHVFIDIVTKTFLS